LPESHGHARDEDGGTANLQSAKPQKSGPHRPEHFRFQLQPDEKQHHDNAELGKMLDRDHIDSERVQQRADRDAGNQIAEHRAETETGCNGNRDNAGGKKNKG